MHIHTFPAHCWAELLSRLLEASHRVELEQDQLPLTITIVMQVYLEARARYLRFRLGRSQLAISESKALRRA